MFRITGSVAGPLRLPLAIALIVLALSVAFAAPAGAASFSALDLGVVHAGAADAYFSVLVTGISSSGQVVGYSQDLGSSTYQAFSATEAGGVTLIDGLPGYPATQAMAVDASGKVFGIAYSDAGNAHAFSWTHGGGTVDLGGLPPLGGGLSYVMSPNGRYIGGGYENSTGAFDAYLWSAASGLHDLGTPPGSASWVVAVNDQGQVIADTLGVNTPAGFFWSPSSGMVSPGALPGSVDPNGNATLLTALSDNGQVVGQALDANDASEAFSWTPGGGIVGLGIPSGYGQADATAVNSTGAVVGNATTFNGDPSAGEPQRAFFWNAAGGRIDLGSPPGTSQTHALDVNNAGQVIGYSYNLGFEGKATDLTSFAWSQSDGMTALRAPGGAAADSVSVENDKGEIASSYEAYSNNTPSWHIALWSPSRVQGRPPPPKCDESTANVLHYDRWSVRLVTTPASGTVATSAQLGSRFMADSMSNPFVEIFTRRHPNGVVRYLARCGYGRLNGSLQVVHRKTSPPLVEFDQKYEITVDPGHPSPSILDVTQRFIFEKEFVEGLNNLQDCEPSGQAPVHNPGHHPCARWKLVLSYSFHPGKGDALHAVRAFERLHFRPDHKMVRGAMLAHDCEPVEMGDDVGDPCVNGPGGVGRVPGLPGIAIFGGENPLRWEAQLGAFRSKCCGFVGEIPENADNLHLTTQESVGLPVPIPPGCPECVHIHWRWGATIGGSDFGGGEPLLGCWEKAVPCSSAGADQDTQVALVSSSNRQYPWPSDLVGLGHNPAVGGVSKAYFGTQPLRDPVVWFSTTTERSQANLFAWGGFFCAPMSFRGNSYGC